MTQEEEKEVEKSNVCLVLVMLIIKTLELPDKTSWAVLGMEFRKQLQKTEFKDETIEN